MTGKLLIDSKQIDLKPETVIAITLQVNDVASVEDRQSSFSNTFNVPKTQGNRQKLEYADLIPTQTTLPYRKLSAQYIQHGIQVIKNGFAVLSESGEDFDVTLYDGNLSFFDLIAGLKLKDITSFTDIMWDLDTAVASRPNTSDHIFALIDWLISMDVTARQYNITQVRPCFFLKDVIAAIMAPTGYTLEGDFIATDLYENLILPLITTKQDEKYLLTEAQTTITPQVSDILGSFVIFNQIITDPVSAFTAGAQSLWDQIDVDEWDFFQTYGNGKYTFSFSIEWETGVDTGYIEILATGTTMTLRHDDLPANSSGTLEFELRDVELNGFSFVGIFFKSNGTDPVLINPGTSMACTGAEVETEFGRIYPIAVNLPDWNQKDLLKAVMNMFCIIPITNTFTKTIRFVRFAEIVANKIHALDWTDKLDMSRKGKLIYQQGNSYAQTNHLRYSPDSTVLEEYGDSSFSIANEILELDKTALTIPFSATEMVIRMNGLQFPDIRNSARPRILILDRQEIPGIQIVWTDGVSSETPGDAEPMCYFTLDGKADNLSFSDNLQENHFTDYIAMLNDFKKVVEPIRLNANDIESLDFSIPIYLKPYAAYFYLNKIPQWISRIISSDVELIKLP